MRAIGISISFLLITALATPSLAELPPISQAHMGLQSQSSRICMEHLAKEHGKGAAAMESSLEREMAAFRTLAERALALRAETIKVGERIKEEMDRGKPLTGEDLAILNRGITEHMALRQELFDVAESHECWLDLTDYEMKAVGMTREIRLKGIMLSLSSALVLYDNYLLAVSLFEGDGKLRRILNEKDPGYAVRSAELAKVTLSYNSVANRERVRRAMRFFEQASKRLKPVYREGSEEDYVNTLILQSPSYTMVRKWSPFHVIGRHLGFLGAVTSDSLSGFERTGVSLFSMVFGNAVGLVETRKGKLYGKGSISRELKGTLTAGDILLEKTPFRLTDKLIPGYWGHAAVWIGTEEELKGLGVWDDPVVRRYRDEIREGRLVVEALRSGVEMNTLDHFLNIDSIGILREKELTPKERATIIVRALRQVGKPYDFNFDVESKGSVYCSKLVYLSYDGIDWPTKKSLGRATFSPDDVAVKALDGGKLKLVTFYHDGRPVKEKPLERMAALMGDAEER